LEANDSVHTAWSPSKRVSMKTRWSTGRPASRDVRDVEHVLSKVDDVLDLVAVVLPHLGRVLRRLPHCPDAAVSSVEVERTELVGRRNVGFGKRQRRLHVAAVQRLSGSTCQLDVLLRHRPPSIPPGRRLFAPEPRPGPLTDTAAPVAYPRQWRAPTSSAA
jgi:hypothetical protein